MKNLVNWFPEKFERPLHPEGTSKFTTSNRYVRPCASSYSS